MSKKKVEETVSGIVALIDSPVIEGYEIKEWSISQFSRLYPYLKTVISALQVEGLNLDNADDFLGSNAFTLIDAFIPVLPEVLAISLSLSQDEVDKISATKASLIGIAILKTNMEHLTSFLAQLKGANPK